MKRAAPFFVALIALGALALMPRVDAGSVQLLDGTTHDGELAIDNGLVVRGEKTVRVPWASVLRATFASPKVEEYQPGLVLLNGTRIAGKFSSLAETTVKFEGSSFSVPGGEIAWVVYQPVGSSRVDLQACKLEYSIVSPK